MKKTHERQKLHGKKNRERKKLKNLALQDRLSQRATPSRWRCAVRHSWEGRNPRRHAAPTYVRTRHACASTRKTAILITFIASTLAKRSPPVPSPSRCTMRKFSVCVACEDALRHSLLYVCNVSYVWINCVNQLIADAFMNVDLSIIIVFNLYMKWRYFSLAGNIRAGRRWHSPSTVVCRPAKH